MKRIKEFLPYILIVVLVSLSYYGILAGKYLLLDRDLYWFFYQNSVYLADNLLSGTLPLWNPYIYNGEPFFAQAQPGVLYPLHWLYMLIPVDELFSRLLVLHIALMGMFTALLVREIGGSRTASAIGGISIIFSGITTSLIALQSSLFAMTWLPLAIWSLIRSLKRDSLSYALLSGISCSLMILVGGIEVLAMTLFVVLFITLFPHIFPIGEVSSGIRRRLYLFCAVFLSFILISAVQIIPFYELTRYSYRTGGVDVAEALTWSLHPREWIYMIIPDIFRRGLDFYWNEQNWLRTIYVGIIPMFLALVFILRGRRKAIGIVALSAGCLLLATGGYLPYYREVVQWIPGLHSIRYPSKFLMIFGFLISLASALGWDSLSRKAGKDSESNRLSSLFIFLSVMFAVLLVLTEISTTFSGQWLHDMVEERGFELLPDSILHNVGRFLAFASLTSLAIFLALKGSRLRKFGLGVIPLLLIIDLMGAMPYTTFFHPMGSLDIVPERIADLESRQGLFRIFSHTGIWDRKSLEMDNILIKGTDNFMPNATMRYRLFNSLGYKVLTLSRVIQLTNSIGQSDGPDKSRLADLLNIRYILWPTEVSSPNYRLIESSDSLFYYENKGALDRAFLAENYEVCNSGVEYQRIMQDPDFDPRALVLLDESPSLPAGWNLSGDIDPEEGDQVNILAYEPERVLIRVKSGKPKFLVLSDAYFPGWKATVNNLETKVYRANYALRAVPVKAGESIVEFQYRPVSVLIGAGISAISILSFLGILSAGFVSGLASSGLLSRYNHLPELFRIKARSANQ